MFLAHKPSKILITGKSGTGKSTFFSKYLLNCPHNRVFLLDHEGEFAFRYQLTPCFTLSEDLVSQTRLIVYDPSQEFPGNSEGAFNYYAETVFELSKRLPGTKLFAADELQKLSNTNEVSYELSLLIETGRRYGIDTCFVSQQPNLIHNRLRNQLTDVVTFSHIDPRATAFLTGLGYNEQELLELQDLEFLALDLRTMAETRGKIEFDSAGVRVDSADEQMDETEPKPGCQPVSGPEVVRSESQ